MNGKMTIALIKIVISHLERYQKRLRDVSVTSLDEVSQMGGWISGNLTILGLNMGLNFGQKGRLVNIANRHPNLFFKSKVYMESLKRMDAY